MLILDEMMNSYFGVWEIIKVVNVYKYMFGLEVYISVKKKRKNKKKKKMKDVGFV